MAWGANRQSRPARAADGTMDAQGPWNGGRHKPGVPRLACVHIPASAGPALDAVQQTAYSCRMRSVFAITTTTTTRQRVRTGVSS